MTRGLLTGFVAGVVTMAAVGWALQLGCRPPADPRVPLLQAQVAADAAAMAEARGLLKVMGTQSGKWAGEAAKARVEADYWRRRATAGITAEFDAGRPDDLKGGRIPPPGVPVAPAEGGVK